MSFLHTTFLPETQLDLDLDTSLSWNQFRQFYIYNFIHNLLFYIIPNLIIWLVKNNNLVFFVFLRWSNCALPKFLSVLDKEIKSWFYRVLPIIVNQGLYVFWWPYENSVGDPNNSWKSLSTYFKKKTVLEQ